MIQALSNFRFGISKAADLHTLHDGLKATVSPILNVDDLLRFEIVQCVSALDAFIHQITLEGMLQIFAGTRVPTIQFNGYRISAESTILLRNTGDSTPIRNEISLRHSYLSFQHPDKIADAIRLFSPVELWKEVAVELGRKPKGLKTELGLIVDRRNKIVHEGDLDPSFPNQQWPITAFHAEGARHFISDLGEAVFRVVA